MTFEQVVIEKLLADALNSGKLRIKTRAKNEYVIQANIGGGTWMTLNALHAKRPPLKAVSND